MKKILMFLACVICLCGCVGTQPSLLDRDLFFENPKLSNSQISPSGEFISFLKDIDGIRNIFLKKTNDEFNKSWQLTSISEQTISWYGWSANGKYILMAIDDLGNENYKLYAVDPVAGSEKRLLTPDEGIYAKLYATPYSTPNFIWVGLNDRDPALHDLYRINIETGERKLAWLNTEGFVDFIFDNKGDLRVGRSKGEMGEEYIWRLENDKATLIFETGELEGTAASHIEADNLHLVLETNKNVDLAEVIRLNIENGEIEIVHRDPDSKVDSEGILYSKRTGDTLAVFYMKDKLRYYPVNKEFEKVWENIEKEFPRANIFIQSSTSDESLLIMGVSSDTDPASAYMYNAETEEFKLMYRSRPNLPAEELAVSENISYLSRDGVTKISGYLTKPRGVSKPYPMVVMPHGGPQSRDVWGYHAYTQFLANRGYAVLRINFRGSAGFGNKFMLAGNREFGTGYMQHDITDGVNYMIEEGVADADKIAIYGGSYGGYATLAGLTFTPDLYRAGISYCGLSNLETTMRSTPAYWKPFMAAWVRRVGDYNNPDDLEDMKSRSPVYFADKIKANLLVIQGKNDVRATKDEADQIARAVRNAGKNVRYLLAPNEGHGFTHADNRRAMATAIEFFLGEELGGRFQEYIPDDVQERLDILSVDIDSL